MNGKFWITGLVPATFTPMHEDGSLNLGQVGPIVDRLVAQGVSALFACGSTGESTALTTEERKATLTAYLTAAAGRLPVIAHVGHTSLTDARDLASHAQANGAVAIAALPPFYVKPGSVAVLVDCMAQIAAAAPELPFYYYHIPGLTGVHLDMVDFLRQGAARIPTLAGIKYSSPTLYEFQACLAFAGGRYNMLFGSDEMLLSGLAAGAQAQSAAPTTLPRHSIRR
ncbi:MAG: dihydrodipicolinate synthase family protein [Anaerolineales bacterium]|nr:dihydrodipicolinate synthase family protein [Anaerolineales bacterium]